MREKNIARAIQRISQKSMYKTSTKKAKRLSVTTVKIAKLGAIAKSPIFLSKYWLIHNFIVANHNLFFWVYINIIFSGCNGAGGKL